MHHHHHDLHPQRTRFHRVAVSITRIYILHLHHKLLSQDSVRVVLVTVVQLRGQRVEWFLNQLLYLSLQLLLRQSHVEAVSQVSHRCRTAVLEARQLGTCNEWQEFVGYLEINRAMHSFYYTYNHQYTSHKTSVHCVQRPPLPSHVSFFVYFQVKSCYFKLRWANIPTE